MATTSELRPSGRAEVRPLTETAIKNLRAGESRTDGALPPGNGRLVLYCQGRTGRLQRIWTFRYRKQDFKGGMTLGEHPALPLTRELIELVRQGGGSSGEVSGGSNGTDCRDA